MYSAYKLNKQGDNIRPWHTPFPILNQPSMSFSNCCLLNCMQVSQETGQVFWYSHFLKNFPPFAMIHPVKGFSAVNEAEVDIFLELSCLFYDPMDVAIWSLVSLPFTNSAWTSGCSRFMKPGLENFEHYFASLSGECNSCGSLNIFGIAFLWNWNENLSFPVLWPLMSFPNLLAY